MQKFIIKMLVGVGVFIVWNMVGGVAEVKAQFVVHNPVVTTADYNLVFDEVGHKLPYSRTSAGESLIATLKESTVGELKLLNKEFYCWLGQEWKLCSFTDNSTKIRYKEVKSGKSSKIVPLYFWRSDRWGEMKLSQKDEYGQEIPIYEMLSKKYAYEHLVK